MIRKICRQILHILIAVICFVSFEANAQVAVDTAKKVNRLDTVKKLHCNLLSLIPPGVAIAYGASSFFIKPVRNVDYYIHGRIERSNPAFTSNAETYFLYTPIVMVYGLNLIGIEGKNTFIDRTALLGLSGR